MACALDGRPGTAKRVRYLWADDAGTDGVSLRTQVGPASVCTAAAEPGEPTGSTGSLDQLFTAATRLASTAFGSLG